MSEKVVCVTGGSGYIASWLVKLLLQRGYTVRASVRDPSDPKKTEHLRALDGASEKLHLFKADLLEEGVFDTAIAGCVGVFHVASPVLFDPTDFQSELIEPAVEGTLNVLKSCAKASTVKRVVVTSSLASAMFTGKPLSPDVVIDETWFSNPDYCMKNKLWYVLSKTLAEEAAWKFSKENGLELVMIHPGTVIGPLLQPTLNFGCTIIYNLINGSTTFPNYSVMPWIDVKDVAMAHVLAYEMPSANGRYCLSEKVAHHSEVVEIIHELYPSIPVPEKCADDKPFAPIYQVSKEKARSLGLNFIPLEESVKETIESLKEKGFLTF
ncbi:Phenylacetaldehyde reductase [Rhynchospora pubera]|uniref:Phenylacetaldehyde reductase n=1 Tax=Rhynchospora pubera TaxID=906938 RepID=A0AAV8C804_9POAL|nr:Phenylacetaldehyde reductase [Rhynchospora pubera]KAJ4766441.1 Phenylacetaldehyde reductase [Rhynchospora pubera]